MYQSKTEVRVRYAETDQMGYVYYGNYATFYEVGRVEALRDLGLSYSELEKMGIMMPVLELRSKFIKPAFYDQLLTVTTIIRVLPNTRIRFEYEITDQDNQLLNIGETTLVFVEMSRNRPVGAPEGILMALKKFIHD
jgi:acyl-CoA thioester hydrolase